MAVSERERRELQEALVGTIGPDPTDTLLSYLPPVGWADVVTKRDLDGKLDALESRLGGRIDRLEGRIDGLEGRMEGLAGSLEAKMHHGFKVLLFWMVTVQFAALGLLFGVFSMWQR